MMGSLAGLALAGLSKPATGGFSRWHALSQPTNVVIAVADDWSWPHAGIFGDQVSATPTFDRIAREGAVFDNAFVSAPSCAPSRAAILTGLYHWQLEQGANMWGSLPGKFPTFPDLLEEAGYHVGFSGKGWGPGVIGINGRQRNPAGKRFTDFDQFLMTRKPHQPFCFWLGSHHPHRPYTWRSGRKHGIDPSKIKVPGHLPDNQIIREDLADYYGEVHQFDSELKLVLDRLAALGELDSTLLIVTSDNGLPFPRCKANLYDLGTRVPLAIRWGQLENPGRRLDAFVNLVDLAPTIMSAVGLSGLVPMSGKSLLPLLTEQTQGGAPRSNWTITGRERHIAAQKGSFAGYPMRALRTRDYLYIRNYEPQRWPAGSPDAYRDVDRSPTKKFLLENRNNKEVAHYFELCFGKRPEEELYDIVNDPEQLNNIAGNRAYFEIRDALGSRLESELAKTNDPRIAGEGDIFDRYRYYMVKGVYR